MASSVDELQAARSVIDDVFRDALAWRLFAAEMLALRSDPKRRWGEATSTGQDLSIAAKIGDAIAESDTTGIALSKAAINGVASAQDSWNTDNRDEAIQHAEHDRDCDVVEVWDELAAELAVKSPTSLAAALARRGLAVSPNGTATDVAIAILALIDRGPT